MLDVLEVNLAPTFSHPDGYLTLAGAEEEEEQLAEMVAGRADPSGDFRFFFQRYDAAVASLWSSLV